MSTRTRPALPEDLPPHFPASRHAQVRAIWPAVESAMLFAGIVPFRNPGGTTARLALLRPKTHAALAKRTRRGWPDGSGSAA